MDTVRVRRKARANKTLTAADVLRSELEKAHDIAPGYVLPGSVVSALEDAGFVIMSADDIENEISLAYQAGVDSVES